MARKLKIMENEKHPLDNLKNDEISENLKNEKCGVACCTWMGTESIKE